MRIAILGAGALGSILAAHLQRAGEDVTLLARGARAGLLAERGVTITGLSNITVPVRVLDNPRDLSDADVLILTVKTYDTEPALEGVRHVTVGSALSVQNGVLKNEQLARVFGREATLGAIADFSGEVMPDGSVQFTRNEGYFIGELPGGISERVETLVSTLVRAGINTIASDRIASIEWSKYVGWMSVTPLAVLSRLETHRILQDPDFARLQVSLVKEAAQLPARLEIPIDDVVALAPAATLNRLPDDEAVATAQQTGADMEKRGIVHHKMSALQDLERGRRLEVHETFGYAVQRAQELGIALPGIETCYRLMAGLDRVNSGRVTGSQ